jgi:cell division topological specificity factor
MNLFGLLRPRKTSAAAARERLHFVLSHERAGRDAPDYMPRLQRDILEAIGKYVTVAQEGVAVRMTRINGTARLEVSIELPQQRLRSRS